MPAAERALPTILVTPATPRPVRRAARLGLPEVYAALAIGSFLGARFFPVLHYHFTCPFLVATGHPCATCGMTHAWVHLAHGRLGDAFLWSPAGTLAAVAVWGYAVADLVRVLAGRPFPRIPEPLLRKWLFAGAALLAVNWAYLLIHGLGP
jgi:hypothetical protein